MNVTDHSVTEAVELTVIFVSPVPLQQQTDDDDDQYEDGDGHHHNDEPGRLEDLILYTVGGWKETTETGQYEFYSETNTAYREVISAQRPSKYIFTWGGGPPWIRLDIHVIYFYKVNIYK